MGCGIKSSGWGVVSRVQDEVWYQEFRMGCGMIYNTTPHPELLIPHIDNTYVFGMIHMVSRAEVNMLTE